MKPIYTYGLYIDVGIVRLTLGVVLVLSDCLLIIAHTLSVQLRER